MRIPACAGSSARQPDLDEVREAASRIAEDGNRAADIIDRLRSLYKKAPPKRELADVNEIVREMVVLMRGEANEYAVSIRTDLSPAFPELRQTVCNCSRC